jgi:hypothetical protein
MLECIQRSVGKPLDIGEQMEGLVTTVDTEDSYKASEMVQGWVNWWPFPVCPFYCILLAVSQLVTVTFPILITIRTHARLSVSTQNTLI